MSKEKADVQKGEVRGAYIGGGIFSILISIPLIFLFVPFFIHSLTGIFLWDPSQIGINSDMLDYVLNYVCYLLPALLLVINIICLFIAKSKSSVFLKLSTLFYILYFVLNYSTKTISGFVGTDIYAMVSGIPYLDYGLIGVGALCTVLGIIFAITDKGHPNRASAFLVISSIIWLIAGAGCILIPMFMPGNETLATYYEPTVLAIYGLVGGLLMLFCCHKKIVILPEGARKPKKGVKNVDASNGDMAGANAMQPQQDAYAMQQMAMQQGGMQQPMQGQVPMQNPTMAGQMPNGMQNGMQPQMGAPMGQPNMQMSQNMGQMPNPAMNGQMPNGMPNAMPQQMPNGAMNPMAPQMPNGMQNGMPPQMQRPPMPNGMPNGAPNGMPNGMPRPPMQGGPNGMPPQMQRPPMPNGAPNGMPPQMPRPPMQGGAPNGMPPMGGQPNPNINPNNQNNANGGA